MDTPPRERSLVHLRIPGKHLAGDRTPPTAVAEAPEAGDSLHLSAAPNPFQSISETSFALETATPVTLRIYDVAGRRVETLLDASHGAGRQTVIWDGRDSGGRPVGAGVYFYRLTTSRGVTTKRIVRSR